MNTQIVDRIGLKLGKNFSACLRCYGNHKKFQASTFENIDTYRLKNYTAILHLSSTSRKKVITHNSKPDLNTVHYEFKPQTPQPFIHMKPHQYKKKLRTKNNTDLISPVIEKIPSFSPEPQFEENFSSKLASKGESMPNSPQKHKGLLDTSKGTYKENKSEFFKEFFRDRDRKLDGFEHISSSDNILPQDFKKGLKARISPKTYWYVKDYESPKIKNIATAPSRKLKFMMMQESRRIRLRANYQPELWDSLKARATKILRRIDLRTQLRFLYCYASIKSNPDYHVKEILSAISERRNVMKPKHHIFFLQALSRLNWRDANININLNEMSLCWPILRNNFLIKAANSLAKLGMANDPLCKPLIYTMNHRIPSFSGKNCYLIKWITVLELFDNEMISKYLIQCEAHKNSFKNYSRNLQVIELYLKLRKPELFQDLPTRVQEFLELLRKFDPNYDIRLKETPRQSALYTTTNPNGNFHSSSLNWTHFLEDSAYKQAEIIYHNSTDYSDQKTDIQVKSPQEKTQKQWSSDLHQEISHSLDLLNLKHINSVSAGPFLIDIYFPIGNIIIETLPPYQFYSETTRLTAQALRRREIICAMGFNIITISYLKWTQLKDNIQREIYIRSVLPPILLEKSI